VFKKKKPSTTNYQPIQKGMYAWTSLHAGSFLLYVESLKDCHKFVFLPGPSEFFLTFDNFSDCVKSGVLEFVEELPDEIYNETIEFSLSCPPIQQKVLLNENN
jgi:hypothetical protein